MRYPPRLLPDMTVIQPLVPAHLRVGANAMIHADMPDVRLAAKDLRVLRAPRLRRTWTVPALRVLMRHYRLGNEPPADERDIRMMVRSLFLED